MWSRTSWCQWAGVFDDWKKNQVVEHCVRRHLEDGVRAPTKRKKQRERDAAIKRLKQYYDQKLMSRADYLLPFRPILTWNNKFMLYVNVYTCLL